MSDDIKTARVLLKELEKRLDRIEAKSDFEPLITDEFKKRFVAFARAVDKRLEQGQVERDAVFYNFCRRCKDIIHELDCETLPKTAIEAGMRGLQFKSDILSRTVDFYADVAITKSEFYDLGMAFDWFESVLLSISLFRNY